MPPPTLEQLFRDFLTTGNEEALALWMRRSGPPLRQLGLRLGASAEDVEDLVQETFVAAIQGADRYDDSRPILPWLKGILTFRAAHLARDEVRRRHHYKASSRDKQTVTAEPDHAHIELDHDVRRAIDDLPQQYREPLAQYLLAQRSPVEIADTLGVKRATVRVRLHRGLQRLRDALQRWGALLLAVLLGRRATAATMVRLAAVLIATLALAYNWFASPAVAGTPPMTTAAVTDRIAASPRDHLAASDTLTRSPASETPATNTPLGSKTNAQLTVVVREAAGLPIAGVGVSIEPASGMDPVLHRRSMVTNHHGTVSWTDLPTGAWNLITDRGQSATAEIIPGSQSHHFTVAASHRTQGVVVDDNGDPVANAAVWLSRDTDGPWRGQEVTASDASGGFELLGVPEGAFVAARHPRFARSAPQQVGTAPITLRLQPPGGCVTVQVEGANQTAVTDAAIYVGDAMDAAPLWLAQGAAPWRSPPFAGRTNASGQFATGALEPGEHPVFVRARGYAPYRSVVHVSPDATTRHVVNLQVGAELHGVITGPHGQPIANAMVIFRTDDSSASIDAIADGDGQFHFDCLPTGPGQVFAKAPGFVVGSTALLLAQASQNCSVVLRQAVAIAGSLLLDGQAAAAGSHVQAIWPATATADNRRIVTVDALGDFVIPNTAGSPPVLRVRLAAEPIWRDVAEYAQWQDHTVTIRLPQSFSANSWIGGHCASDDQQPVAGGRVFICRDQDQWSEVGRTDREGNYRVGPLPGDHYQVFVESTQHTQPTLVGNTIELAANANERVDLIAQATGEVDISLKRNDGKPLADVLMTIQRADLHRRFAISNRGLMRQRLEAGEYVLSVMGSSVMWIDEHRFTVRPGAVTPVALTLQAARNCTLLVGCFPERPTDRPTTIRMRKTAEPQWQPTITLLPHAPMRIGAVLAPGTYWLEHTAEDGSSWRGDFAVASSGKASRPIHVAMHCVEPSGRR